MSYRWILDNEKLDSMEEELCQEIAHKAVGDRGKLVMIQMCVQMDQKKLFFVRTIKLVSLKEIVKMDNGQVMVIVYVQMIMSWKTIVV